MSSYNPYDSAPVNSNDFFQEDDEYEEHEYDEEQDWDDEDATYHPIAQILPIPAVNTTVHPTHSTLLLGCRLLWVSYTRKSFPTSHNS